MKILLILLLGSDYHVFSNETVTVFKNPACYELSERDLAVVEIDLNIICVNADKVLPDEIFKQGFEL